MKQPAHDYYDHPVFHPNRLRLKTEAMKKLNEDLHRWLWTGATGGLITGGARVGKTTALLELSNRLYTRAKVAVPAYYVSVPDRDQRTIVSVFRHLCWSANLRVKRNDRADHLADRYVHFIVDKAVETGCSNAVLIVDEMQRLVASQLNAFAELYDKLLLLDVSLTVIFVGNDPECWRLIEQIETSQYAHIHGRFFTQGLSIQGLTSKAQVQSCLNQYDKLHYPENGPAYTEYFLPEAAKNGWRLSSLSSDIWRVFSSYKKDYQVESWGMKYFTATINTLLSDFLPHHGVEQFDDDMVHECIRISGLVPSLVRPAS